MPNTIHHIPYNASWHPGIVLGVVVLAVAAAIGLYIIEAGNKRRPVSRVVRLSMPTAIFAAGGALILMQQGPAYLIGLVTVIVAVIAARYIEIW